MLHLRHIDFVVGFVCAYPFDPHDRLFKVDSHDESIVITLDVEDDPLAADDACSCIKPSYIR
jgi:hypothetical protein